MQECTALPSCPSLDIYSSYRFAEVADTVAAEWNTDERCYVDTSADPIDDDDDFEFALVRTNDDVAADEIFLGGYKSNEIFPIFNRGLLVQADQDRVAEADVPTRRLPLKKFFAVKRDAPSSSESGELEGVDAGTYCVWRPNSVEALPSRCKKSSSTGTASKRWKLLDLVRRSNSDGKAHFVNLTPKIVEQKVTKAEGHTSGGKTRGQGSGRRQ
ncbi:hypothetical protein NMG60_11026609 [Bertholletia excelsa]